MPVARGPQINARSAVIVGFTGVMIALVLGAGVLWLARSSGEVEIQLGDTDFDAGFTGRIATEIDDRGPILYSDVAGRSRDIILQHLGDDPGIGWLAFNARPLGEPRDCFFEWRPEAQRFELITTENDVECAEVTMNEAGLLSSGELISSYPVEVDSGNSVRVDINFQADEDAGETSE